MPFPASFHPLSCKSPPRRLLTKTITRVFLMARTLLHDLEALQLNTAKLRTKLLLVKSAYEAKRGW